MLEEYFDNIYLLNLHRRGDRMEIAHKRMQFAELEYERFGATDGASMSPIWRAFSNPHFKNPNYLACAISHLSIYRDALERGFKRILILEDDNRIHRDIKRTFEAISPNIPEWKHLLYLGFIPLSDDCTKWDYSVINGNFISANTFIAKNLWGLYAYGITNTLMREVVETYDRDFPMELDRFFVTNIQPRGLSYGVFPQLFAAEDGISDNSGVVETGMLQRSVHPNFANYTDYI